MPATRLASTKKLPLRPMAGCELTNEHINERNKRTRRIAIPPGGGNEIFPTATQKLGVLWTSHKSVVTGLAY